MGRSPRRLATTSVVALLTAAIVAGPAAPVGGAGPATEEEQQVAVVTDAGVEARVVSDDELLELEGSAPGHVVTRGRAAAPEIAQSVPKVGAPAFWGLGHRGAGRVIAIIDTGVGTAFGGDIVGQACFSATQQGSELVGHCGPGGDVTEAFDGLCFDLEICGVGDVLDPAAGRPCSEPEVPKDCAHGSAVAAVAARHEPTPGVAPDAGVYAIQVFRPTGQSADFVDILLALDHVADLADAGVDLAAANLSLSSSETYPSHCDTGPGADGFAIAFRSAIQRLDVRGIAVTVATGNDGQTGSLGLPACVSNAIAVGASDLDDQIADFSNRGPAMELVAPGTREGNGALDGLEIPGSPVFEWSGTSFAAPHVAGAFALLQAEYAKASVHHLLGHLRGTGALATDLATGAVYRRLRLLPPAEGLAAGVLFPADANVAGTTRGAVGDFDGDGFGDVLAHAPGGATDRIAYGRSGWSPSSRSYAVTGSYAPIVGNFRGSSADDIVWYAAGATPDWLWTGDVSRTFSTAPLAVNGTYFPLVGDYDGDGYDDIVWYGPGRSFDTAWYGGPSGFTSRSLTLAGVYRTAIGDVDGDTRDDIVFHAPGSAADALWKGTTTRGTWLKSSLTIGGSNELRVGDFDGDADDDLLLYQAGSGTDSIWRGGPGVGGGGPTGGFAPLAVSVNGSYRPSVADIGGDGRDDIVWYAPGSTGDFLWFGRASGVPSSRPLSVSGTYTPLLADLDDDAGADIVWFQSVAPSTPVWFSHTG